MSILTLTTDLGVRDYYVAALKGALLSAAPNSTLVDVTHDINNFDILQAAYTLRNCWVCFPKGTVHIVVVALHAVGGDLPYRFLLAEREGHYFIAPDNGFFSLMFDDVNLKTYEVEGVFEGGSLVRNGLAQVVSSIHAGRAPEDIGKPTSQPLQRLSIQPVIGKSQIRGTVIYVDNFENVVINVDKAIFERVGQGRPFELYFKRHNPITVLSAYYSDVAVGEPLCLFNGAGFMEIAIYMGKAASLLGLSVDDSIQIDFRDVDE
jgi:S-adenosylmethionine hydrolase